MLAKISNHHDSLIKAFSVNLIIVKSSKIQILQNLHPNLCLVNVLPYLSHRAWWQHRPVQLGPSSGHCHGALLDSVTPVMRIETVHIINSLMLPLS